MDKELEPPGHRNYDKVSDSSKSVLIEDILLWIIFPFTIWASLLPFLFLREIFPLKFLFPVILIVIIFTSLLFVVPMLIKYRKWNFVDFIYSDLHLTIFLQNNQFFQIYWDRIQKIEIIKERHIRLKYGLGYSGFRITFIPILGEKKRVHLWALIYSNKVVPLIIFHLKYYANLNNIEVFAKYRATNVKKLEGGHSLCKKYWWYVKDFKKGRIMNKSTPQILNFSKSGGRTTLGEKTSLEPTDGMKMNCEDNIIDELKEMTEFVNNLKKRHQIE